MPAGFRVDQLKRAKLATAVGCLCFALLAQVALSVTFTGDYMLGVPVGGDNAAPGIQALLHGSLAGYVAHQPVIGLTSILLRLPFVAVATVFGAGSLRAYQVGALACMLPLALLAAWLVSAPGLTPRQRLYRLLAVLLVIESPILYDELTGGHPEGMVAGVLACGAVIAATRGRPRWAAVMLGLSIAAKEWGVIAILPVMIAVPGRRREVATIAGGVVLLLCGVVSAVDPHALMRALHGEGKTTLDNPLSVLWPLGTPLPAQESGASIRRVIAFGLSRTGATLLTLTVAAPVFLAWFVRARRRGATCDPLALLALLGVLRTVCDSTHIEYYEIAVLLPVAAWDATRNRIPWLTALVSIRASLLYGAEGAIPAMELYAWSIGTSAVLILYLARRAMVAPGRQPAWEPISRALGGALRERQTDRSRAFAQPSGPSR